MTDLHPAAQVAACIGLAVVATTLIVYFFDLIKAKP